MTSTQYLFLFTIGPVQSFIAQARKTRDLYAGSAILGDIIDAAMRKTRDMHAEIIVPDYDQGAKPNRFLAKIKTDDAQVFGKDIENAARAEWVDIALRSFNAAGVCHTPETNGFDESRKQKFNCEKLEQVKPKEAKAQIEDFVEIYWVALPYEEGKDNYAKNYLNLQLFLSANKNTRKFNQIDEPAGRKCSVDGERNALFYRKTANSAVPAMLQRNQDNEKIIDASPISSELLACGEALSAVSLVKRFYKAESGSDEDTRFPSTAKIALLKVLEKIDKNVLKAYKDKFLHDFDEQLYYEENLTKSYLLKKELGHLIPTISELQRQREKIFKGNKLPKYYAIIAFDGDNMGKIWAGKELVDEENQNVFQSNTSEKRKQFQELLASRLGIYAAYAKAYLDGTIKASIDGMKNGEAKIWQKILKDKWYNEYYTKAILNEEKKKLLQKEKGRTVYAGGDDFLGLVNLAYLTEVMQEFREAYEQLVSKPINEDYRFKLNVPLTFSAGIAIAHYKEPLSVVLSEANLAEKESKNRFNNQGKNAFTISVLKHSGESQKCSFQWSYNHPDDIYICNEIRKIVLDLQDNNGFSNTFLKNIDKQFRPLMDQDSNYYEFEIVRIESCRLIKRAYCGNRENKKNRCDALSDSVRHLQYQSMQISNYFSALHICDFINRETAK